MGEHSAFGGSSIGRVIACPGSVALLATVPAKGESPYAAEGTLAHEFAEYFLREGERNCLTYVGCTLDGVIGAKPLSEDMAKAIQVYLDAVWAEVDLTPNAEYYVETKFVLDVDSAAPGEVHGKNDCMVYHPSTGRLVVFDYKHGVGVSVTADDNAQLKFYAAGAVFSQDWKVSELVLVIVQPRARDVDDIGAVRSWNFDTIELLEFKAEVNAAIICAKSPSAALAVGSHCRWCDAAAVCPAKQVEALSVFEGVNIENLDNGATAFPDPKSLVPEKLSQIVARLHILQSYANQCQEYLEALLLGGTPVPGWKVVEKIGRAKWVSDEQTIAGSLEVLYDLDEDLIRPRKLTTITEVEKLMKAAGASKSEIDDFKLANTIKESSGLTIAPEGDRRPAVDAAERAFGDVQS